MTRASHKLRSFPRWFAILFAPLLVILILALAELACTLGGVAPPQSFFRLEVDEQGAPWYVESRDSPRPEARFRVARFSARKPAGTFRIVCLGDSTTYGLPFDEPAPYACWIQARLARFLPDTKVEVLNLGGNGFNARAIRELLQEILDADADLYVLYSGHNEFLEQNLAAAMHPTTDGFRRWLSRLRLGRWLLRQGLSNRGELITTLRDRERIHETPPIPARAIERGQRDFRVEVSTMVELAHGRGREILLCLPVADLRDTPVQINVFRVAHPTEEKRLFLDELDAVRRERIECESIGRTGSVTADPGGRALVAIERLDALVRIDAGVAALDYERARWSLLLGASDAACVQFQRALDADGHPIRATTRMREILAEVARELHAPCADPWPLFRAAAGPSLPGQDGWFVDYCHPDLRGHELIAESILTALREHSIPRPASQWIPVEPTRDEYRAAMGFRDDQQAITLARQALFALGRSFLDPRSAETEEAARSIDLALRIDPRCAPAMVGRGFLAALRKDASSALEQWHAAWLIDPQSLELVQRSRATNPEVDRVLKVIGIELDPATLEPHRR